MRAAKKLLKGPWQQPARRYIYVHKACIQRTRTQAVAADESELASQGRDLASLQPAL